MKAPWAAAALLAAAVPALARTASLRAGQTRRLSDSAEAARLRVSTAWQRVARIPANQTAILLPGGSEEDQEDFDGKGPTLRTVCSVKGSGPASAVGDVSVILNRLTNERVLSFAVSAADTGGETSVTCEGGLTDEELATCVSGEGKEVTSAADCPVCPCKKLATIEGFPGRFAYMTEMAAAVQRECSRTWNWPGDSFNVLVIGMGGGAMATHIAQSCPKGVHIDGVEYDDRVIGVSERYFGVEPSEYMTVEQGDALDAVRERAANGRTYDAVLIDCFSEGGITPDHCRNEEFVAGLRSIMGKNGFIAHHLWHRDPDHKVVEPEFNATVALYRSHFNATRVQPLATEINDVVYSSAVKGSLPEDGSDDAGLQEFAR